MVGTLLPVAPADVNDSFRQNRASGTSVHGILISRLTAAATV